MIRENTPHSSVFSFPRETDECVGRGAQTIFSNVSGTLCKDRSRLGAALTALATQRSETHTPGVKLLKFKIKN